MDLAKSIERHTSLMLYQFKKELMHNTEKWGNEIGYKIQSGEIFPNLSIAFVMLLNIHYNYYNEMGKTDLLNTTKRKDKMYSRSKMIS